MHLSDKPLVLVNRVNKVFRSKNQSKLLKQKQNSIADVQAVRDVSFAAYPGESIGILGRNGSGKSTLLNMIAGSEPPTSGDILTSSQPTLLGVSAALQPDLNGWDNAKLGLLAMGKTPTECEKMLKDIILWASLGRAANRPMKTYSSGMQARLKFSIATSVPREILLVDEALSTGDSTFSKRAHARVQSFLRQAGVVFVVSHSTRQIQKYCDRCIWLHEGEVIADGNTGWVTRVYSKWSSYTAAGRDDLAEALINRTRQKYDKPIFEYVDRTNKGRHRATE